MLRVTRVLAPNPSVFTLEGTNTWIAGEGPVVVIDPGPTPPVGPGTQCPRFDPPPTPPGT